MELFPDNNHKGMKFELIFVSLNWVNLLQNTKTKQLWVRIWPWLWSTLRLRMYF